MTIQQFIEAAIEGGTLLVNDGAKSAITRIDVDSAFIDGRFYIHFFESESEMRSYNTYEVLLNPEAWKAVGRVRGHGEYTDTDLMWFEKKMHEMIDFLLLGKTLEEYIATL